MQYLDENIQFTISGFNIVTAGTYVYQVQDGQNNVIFVGNCFLNVGQTSKTFDITDILANIKYRSSLKTPLYATYSSKINVINTYKVVLTINNTNYTSSQEDVALLFRYPNRKNRLEATLFDHTEASEYPMAQNCLQGAKNGVVEYLPHIPYKESSNMGFGVVMEYASGSTFSGTTSMPFSFDGQLYGSIPETWTGGTSENFTTLFGLFNNAGVSHQIIPTTTPNDYTDDYESGELIWQTQPAVDPSVVTITANGGTTSITLDGDTVVSLDIDMTGSNKQIDLACNHSTAYIRLSSNDYTGLIHLEFDCWYASGPDLFNIRRIITSVGNVNQEETYLDINAVGSLIGEAIYSDTIIEYDGAKNFLVTLGYTEMEAEGIIMRLDMGKTTMIYSGTTAEVNEVFPRASAFFDCWREPVYGSAPQHVAIVDMGCLPKYYLLWQDRYGGYQCQPFEKVDTFGIEYKYEEMKDYQNRSRNINIDLQPKWKVQTNWIDEQYYPYYESIFVSPYVVLYDTDEDKVYNVIPTDKEYTEKTWYNQHKFFNLELNLKLDKQTIIY